jgi:hypothetical protein
MTMPNDKPTFVLTNTGVPPWALAVAFAAGLIIAGALIVTFVRIEDDE